MWRILLVALFLNAGKLSVLSQLIIVLCTPLAPTDLRVESIPTPVIGLDVQLPRFTWTINTLQTDRAQYQTSYQVRSGS